MYSKRPRIPLEVSSWMEKDLTLRKITANSRLLTNETRQNIVLSRRFFSDLLNLSYTRYRKLAEHDFDKKMFLRNQLNKSEAGMPGLRPYVDQLTYNMNRATSSRIQSSRKADSSLMCPSAQSFLSRPGTKSDPRFNRRQQSSIRQIKTAQIRKSQPSIAPPIDNSTTTSNQGPPSAQQMSRERLNRLAQPKGYRSKSAITGHIHTKTSDETPTAEDVFGEIDQTSQITSLPMHNTLSAKPKSAVNDNRFHHLMDVFSKIHGTQASNLLTLQSIVQANTSLQDDQRQSKIEHSSESNRKAEFKHHRQMLAEKLHNKIDIFLIDVGA